LEKRLLDSGLAMQMHAQKERTMYQAKLNADFGGWLRRTWNAMMRAAEVMEVSPMEDLFDRVDRLENEMAALKKRKAGAWADRQT
jgi:polyhydroxyalkanoate synthesis regulator phasin